MYENQNWQNNQIPLYSTDKSIQAERDRIRHTHISKLFYNRDSVFLK